MESSARASAAVADRLPDRFQNIVDEAIVRFKDRLVAIEKGLSEFSRRVSTVNVVNLGEHVRAMASQLQRFGEREKQRIESIAGVGARFGTFVSRESLSQILPGAIDDGLAPRLVGVEAKAHMVQERQDGLEALVTKLATVTTPGLVANGVAQGLALAMPDVTSCVVAAVAEELQEALPRRLAAERVDDWAHADHDSRSSFSPGSLDGGAGDDNEEEGITWI